MPKGAARGDRRSPTTQDDEALALFAEGGSLPERAEGLRLLLQDRGLHRVRETEKFGSGLKWLVTAAGRRTSSDEPLVALALLRKIANTVKTTGQAIAPDVGGALEHPLPGLTALASGEDRALVLAWLGDAKAAWATPYIARAAVQEELQAKNSRDTAISLLLKRSPDLSTALDVLSTAVASWSPSTKTPGETAAKMLTAVLDALRKALANTTVTAGKRPGEALSALIAAVRAKHDGSVTLQTLELVADSGLRMIEQVARSQIVLAFPASTYAPARALREWFGTFGAMVWRTFAAKSEGAAVLATMLEDAITIVAKQGVSDESLFEQLVVICGAREVARSRTKRIADGNVDIPHNVRKWLALGESDVDDVREAPASAPAGGPSWDHERIGQLMQAADKLSRTTQTLEAELLPEVEMLLPRHAAALRGQIGAAGDASTAVLNLAQVRGLRLRGTRGTIERYSPTLHRVVGGATTGFAWVRLISPPVEYVRDDSVSRLVLPGLAEPAEEPAP